MKSYPTINDNSCGWQKIISAAPDYSSLDQHIKSDWVIIGAGFSGISAAYRLAELRPDDVILLLDAEQAGHGASARNSGYIVDVTLNDGTTSPADEHAQIVKAALNRSGLNLLRQRVSRFNIDCDWDEAGKFHCAADPRHLPKLDRFARFLQRHDIPHQVWTQQQLGQRLGTEYYRQAVYTAGSVLVNPAALTNGLLQNLPANIQIYQNTPILNIHNGSIVTLQTPGTNIEARQVIVTVNALMPRLGLKASRVFPLVLSASLTRPLNDTEFESIGQPKPWGVLSASPMGATVRLTADRRIMIRNTVEWRPKLAMSDKTLAARRQRHLLGLRRRFPTLDRLEIEHSWSGTVCISRNAKPVFERVSKNLFLAGCYNAGGIAMGSLFGHLIADYACGETSEELSRVLQQDKPSRLPPRPFFDLGLQTSLAFKRFRGRNEA